MSFGELFGGLVAVTALLSWMSRDQVIQKLWFVLLMEWASTNLAVDYLGFDRAMLVIPPINGVLATVVATIGLSHYRNRAGLAAAVGVFAIYGAVGVTHVAAYATLTVGTNLHYATLNGLFFLQNLILGGIGGWLAVRHRSAGRRQRARADNPRGQGVARGP